jgi:ABC-type Fe3+ transport system substrate-binding protein
VRKRWCRNGSCCRGSNEVGTVYYSDIYGFEEDLIILEEVPYELTGDVIYPAAQVVNPEADELESESAKAFVEFLLSDEAKEIFQSYYFDTNLDDEETAEDGEAAEEEVVEETEEVVEE